MVDDGAGWTAAGTSQGQELVPRPDPEHRQGTLIGVDRHAEQPLIELDGSLLVRHEEREMVELAHGEQPGARCRLRCRQTALAQQPGPTAVARVLQLDDDPVRVSEVELGCTRRCTAERFPAHPDARLHRAGLARRRDTVLAENPHDPLVVEVIHRETQMGDAWIVARTAAQRHELGTTPDPEHHRLGLTCRDRHAEQPLVPLQRTRRVRHAECHVIDGLHRNRRPRLQRCGGRRCIRGSLGCTHTAVGAATGHRQRGQRAQEDASAYVPVLVRGHQSSDV